MDLKTLYARRKKEKGLVTEDGFPAPTSKIKRQKGRVKKTIVGDSNPPHFSNFFAKISSPRGNTVPWGEKKLQGEVGTRFWTTKIP